MSQLDSARVRALFEAVVELPPASREDVLARECSGNPELLAEVRELLEFDAQFHGTTVQPIAAGLVGLATGIAPEAVLSGMRVGPFELREELGRGGMGVVYRAERVDGSVSQQVAIKFVRRELLDAETRRRFLLERQTLAAMDHPNIARLLDAAALDDGTPYYVMEYVAGVPITEYCDRAKLGIRERVALFRTVCGAVAQAHQSLVVHRDLKPGNILVTDGGVPKLLDFGIAKPLVQVDTTTHAQTGTAQRYFSPMYAAPEQLLGAPIGVGCDVYALGLLLYELLVGSRPFDFTDLSAGQIERLVTTVPPPAPSTAAAQSGKSSHEQRQLRGDLDGIVLRCLRKLPAERYASVEQLGADLRNYLEGLPVQARGGHAWYRARKFVGRHVGAVAAAVLVTVALITGVVAFAWQARIAQQRAAELEQVANFQAAMLGQVDPTQAGLLLRSILETEFTKAIGKEDATEQKAAFVEQLQFINVTDAARTLINRTMLAPAVAAIDAEFSGQPLVDARLRQVVADRYQQWGLLAEAKPLQERALLLRKEALGDGHVDTLRSMIGMAELKRSEGEYGEAEAHAQQVLATRQKQLGAEHPDTLGAIHWMAILKLAQGRLDEAEKLATQALVGRQKILGDEHTDTVESLQAVGRVTLAKGKAPEAEVIFSKVYELRRRLLGEDHQRTFGALEGLVGAFHKQGEYAKGEPYSRKIAEQTRRSLGESYPQTIEAISNLGATLEFAGKLDEGLQYRHEAWVKARRVFGDSHPDTLIIREGVGSVLMSLGRLPEAETHWQEVLEIRRRVLGNEHPDTLSSLLNVGLIVRAQNRSEESEPFLREAFETRRRVLGDSHRDTLLSLINLGSIWVMLGHHADAVSLMTPNEATFQETFGGANSRFSWKYAIILGRGLVGAGEYAVAEPKLLTVEALISVPEYKEIKDKRDCYQALFDLYTKWGSADPGKGHESKAASWKVKLDQVLDEIKLQTVKA